MLQLIIEGKRAVLSPDTSLSVQLKNSLLTDSEEDSTYPFTLPVSENRHIFGFPDLINNNDFIRQYSGMVMFGPYQILSGEVIITDISDSEIELYIATNNRSFWGKFGKKYLDEYDLGSETWSYDAFNSSLRNYKPYVCIQLYDPSFDVEGYIPEWYNRWQMVYSRLQVTQNGIKNNICPFMRLKEVIERIFTNSGYTISYNVMDEMGYFENILIIHRHTFNEPSTFHYNEVLPHITIQEFLEECRRKFGLVFFINEAGRTVIIRSSVNLRTDNTLPLEIFDNFQKTIDSESENKVYKFTDKSVTDKFIDAYAADLVYITGDENSENLTTVECISTIMGTENKLEQFFSGEIDSLGESVFLSVRYTLLSTASQADDTEFRLAVYNGLANRIEYADTITIPIAQYVVPEASLVGVGFNLLWTGEKGLYNVFHRALCGIDTSLSVEMELNRDIRLLNNLQNMFVCSVVCRNQRFVVREQEIEFCGDRTVSHKITAIPV